MATPGAHRLKNSSIKSLKLTCIIKINNLILFILHPEMFNYKTYQKTLIIRPTAAGKNRSSLPIRHRRLKATRAGISLQRNQ